MSWSSTEEDQSTHNSRQWWVLQHRHAVQVCSFCESALYLPRISSQTRGSPVIGWHSKTTPCPRKPNAAELERFQFDVILWAKSNISVHWRNSTIRSRKEIIMLQVLLKMVDEENARQCAKKTQRPETGRDSKPYASILGSLRLLMFPVLRCKYHH